MLGKPSLGDLLCSNARLATEHPTKALALRSALPAPLPAGRTPVSSGGRSPFLAALQQCWNSSMHQLHLHQHFIIILSSSRKGAEGPGDSVMSRLAHKAGSAAWCGSDLENASYVPVFSLTFIISLNRLPQLIYFELS